MRRKRPRRVAAGGRRRGARLRRLVGRRGGDDEVGLAGAQPQFDRAGCQLSCDLVRGSGEGIEQHQADHRLERRGQALGLHAGVLATSIGSHSELAPEGLDVRCPGSWHQYGTIRRQDKCHDGSGFLPARCRPGLTRDLASEATSRLALRACSRATDRPRVPSRWTASSSGRSALGLLVLLGVGRDDHATQVARLAGGRPPAHLPERGWPLRPEPPRRRRRRPRGLAVHALRRHLGGQPPEHVGPGAARACGADLRGLREGPPRPALRQVETGVLRRLDAVELVNDGPVTLLLEG